MLFVASDLELNLENETNFEKCLGFYVVIGILTAALIIFVQTVQKSQMLELYNNPIPRTGQSYYICQKNIFKIQNFFLSLTNDGQSGPDLCSGQ